MTTHNPLQVVDDCTQCKVWKAKYDHLSKSMRAHASITFVSSSRSSCRVETQHVFTYQIGFFADNLDSMKARERLDVAQEETESLRRQIRDLEDSVREYRMVSIGFGTTQQGTVFSIRNICV